MKLLQVIPTVTLFIASAFILPACAVKQTQPLLPESVAMKILPATEVYIFKASARQEDDNVVVEGQISRKKIGGGGGVKGHIDIKIIDKHGTPIRQVFADFSPKIVPKLSGLSSHFSTTIPGFAPQGSTVVIKFHNGFHES